jgi:hypothetical protein
MKNLSKLSFLVISGLLLQSPAVAADEIQIKQQGNNIIIIKNGQQKILKDIPKQDGIFLVKETIKKLKKIFQPDRGKIGNLLENVEWLDISEAEKFHFCYVPSKPITLWHPDKQRNTNRLILQQDGGKTVKARWKPGQHFEWKPALLPIEDGVTYTITIGPYSPRVTLHKVSDYVTSNENYGNYKIGQQMADNDCLRQALFLMLPNDVIAFLFDN